jgi:ribonuclease P protein subunit RPR2
VSGPKPDPATIAAERVERLTALAREATLEGHDERARRYVRLARRVAERHRLRRPRALTRHTCDACDRYLVVGRNARHRLRDGHVVVTCDCGHQQRYPYG